MREEARGENARLREALTELVRLKDEKAAWRSDAELDAYQIAKDEAWTAARALLSLTEPRDE